MSNASPGWQCPAGRPSRKERFLRRIVIPLAPGQARSFYLKRSAQYLDVEAELFDRLEMRRPLTDTEQMWKKQFTLIHSGNYHRQIPRLSSELTQRVMPGVPRGVHVVGGGRPGSPRRG